MLSVMPTHLLVANPTSQSGKNAERIERALSFMRDVGFRPDLLTTLPEGKTIGAVRTAIDRESYEVVVAMGGDGTFREVAAGIYTSRHREHVAMGMLPTGTANDQGKSFGLDAAPAALESNLEVIRVGHETRLDVGIYRSSDDPKGPAYFCDSAGWGFSARILAQRNRDRAAVEKLGPLKEIYRDQAVYIGAFVKKFLESYVVDDRLRVAGKLDGRPFELDDVTDLIVKNTRVYAGAWVFEESARHDDGVFEIVPFFGKADWTKKALFTLEKVSIPPDKLEKIGIDPPKPLRGSMIELEIFEPEGGAPLAAQLDGEEWPACRRVRIEVAARAIRLLVPEGT